jgi:hypothetical protein
MWKPETDITKFISKLTNLADLANVPATDRKALLWDHIPPGIDHRLLHDSKNKDISWEEFTEHVANAAHSAQRAYELRQKNRTKNDEKDNDKKGNRDSKTSGNKNNLSKNNVKPTTTATTTVKATDGKPVTMLTKKKRLTDEEKRVHFDADTCFVCGQAGHRSTECPDREKVPAIRAFMARKAAEEAESASPSSSDSEN